MKVKVLEKTYFWFVNVECISVETLKMVPYHSYLQVTQYHSSEVHQMSTGKSPIEKVSTGKFVR